ncbi:STY4526/YPO1902 family pathogenicity island replication protein [Photobacterium frigidiphilum]|uniref:STY4526/YPO1902 family pathogenicity island replication protein n=1 Tax=Photobacterium frigidiphilum TaxID=264736 RepID=UPI001474B043|nr:STY4526/YPO1902 family pathogenicity island replication protein [Photobacterium frigidiphilum]
MSNHIETNSLFLNQVCMLAKFGSRPLLQSIGLSDDNTLDRLAALSANDIEDLAIGLGDAFLVVNMDSLLSKLDGNIEMSDECKAFLARGASNKAMKDILGVYDESLCAAWRNDVGVSRIFRRRTLPDKQYKAVWLDLEKLPKPVQAVDLIQLADKHNVSIGAMWRELISGEQHDSKK